MKKNRTMRIATLMLALTLITCCFVGSTFAKYTSSASGQTSVQVAKWDIKYNGNTITTVGSEQNVDFKLFDTIKDTAGAAEDDVLAVDGKVVRIAPGTEGSFSYKITNASDVTAEYYITYAANTTVGAYKAPIQFSLDKNTWYTDITKLNVGDATNSTNAQRIEMTDGEDDITVYWQWAFGDVTDVKDDVLDTNVGLAAQDVTNITVSIAIRVDQVD